MILTIRNEILKFSFERDPNGDVHFTMDVISNLNLKNKLMKIDICLDANEFKELKEKVGWVKE